jgi:hypothetical protein
MVLLLVVGWAVARFGARLEGADLQRLYMYVGATAAFFLASSATLIVIAQAVSLWVGRTGDVRYVREILSDSAAVAIVAWPLWLWHIRRAADLSRLRRATSLHRSYLYLVAIVSLVAAISFGGVLVAQGVRLIIGTVNLSDLWTIADLKSNAAIGLADGSLCAAVWWLSIRAVNRWQDKAPATAPADAGG